MIQRDVTVADRQQRCRHVKPYIRVGLGHFRAFSTPLR